MFFTNRKKKELQSFISNWDVLQIREMGLTVNPPGFERSGKVLSHWSLAITTTYGEKSSIRIEKLEAGHWGLAWNTNGREKRLGLAASKEEQFIKDLMANSQMVAKESLFAGLTAIKGLPIQGQTPDPELLTNESKALEWLKATLATMKGAFGKAGRDRSLLYSGKLRITFGEGPSLVFQGYNISLIFNWADQNNNCLFKAFDVADSSAGTSTQYEACWSVLRHLVLEEMTLFLGSWVDGAHPAVV